MKNLLWIILLSLCFQHAFAQRKMHFGLKAEPNIGWFQPKSDDLESDGGRLGFSYGLITDFNFNENYSFGTGLEINHFGGSLVNKTNMDGVEGELKQDLKLQYIQVPLTLKMRSKEIGYITYYGQFGVGVSGLIGAKADNEFSAPFGKVKESDVNVYDDVRFFRASMVLGLGIEYNISGTTSLVFGASFDNGFINPLKGKAYKEDPSNSGMLVEGSKRKANGNFVSLTIGVIF